MPKLITDFDVLEDNLEHYCDGDYNFTKEEYDKYALEIIKEVSLLEYKEYIFGKNYFNKK